MAEQAASLTRVSLGPSAFIIADITNELAKLDATHRLDQQVEKKVVASVTERLEKDRCVRCPPDVLADLAWPLYLSRMSMGVFSAALRLPLWYHLLFRLLRLGSTGSPRAAPLTSRPSP